jgi:hypothetical protein
MRGATFWLLEIKSGVNPNDLRTVEISLSRWIKCKRIR